MEITLPAFLYPILFTLNNDQESTSIHFGLDSRVEHLLWSPDKKSKTLAASSRQGHLTLYDVSEIIQ